MKDWISVALPKGRLGEKAYDLFERIGFGCPAIREDNRKLIFENVEARVRYFWAKPSDVAIYVERGAADVGVAGGIHEAVLFRHGELVEKIAEDAIIPRLIAEIKKMGNERHE